jgi:hypothetical protein
MRETAHAPRDDSAVGISAGRRESVEQQRARTGDSSSVRSGLHALGYRICGFRANDGVAVREEWSDRIHERRPLQSSDSPNRHGRNAG